MSRPGRTLGLLALAALGAAALTAVAGPVTARPAAADPVRDNEWALDALHVRDVWPATRGGGVLVAVLDTGVDPTHPDLIGRVSGGADFIGGDAHPGDAFWGEHGTAMASDIAGHGHGPGGGDGVLGVAPDASILSVRVILDPDDPIRNLSPSARAAALLPGDSLAEGIQYAITNGARVINLSLGEADTERAADPADADAIAAAIASGVVVVAAAGNSADTSNSTQLPAAYPGVIAVAASDKAGHRAPFSTHAWTSDVAAPGVDVLGAKSGGGYLIGDGTSPAAAFVSGVCALILARYPHLSPAQVRDVLERTAAAQPAGSYDEDLGWGIVQPAAALQLAGTLTPEDVTPVAALARPRTFGGGTIPDVSLRPLVQQALVGLALVPLGGGLLVAAVLVAALRRRPARPGRPPGQ